MALALGAAQAWATRFAMNPDGISYLDIGDAYWRGDWHNAINAYWSPLYSWILGFFLKVLKPSMYWEYPVVHLVNLLIYVAALASFEFFLATFIADRKKRDQEFLKKGLMGLPESAWWLLGYNLFVSSSLLLIGLAFVTPDMCAAAFLYLASGLVLRIRSSVVTRRTFAVLGVVLGAAYLAKAVMFPLGIVFLAVAMFAGGVSRSSLRSVATAALTFLVVTSPFIMAISYAKGRPTFGDSGRVTYEAFINGIDAWYPGDGGRLRNIGGGTAEDIDGPSLVEAGSLRHPPERIFDAPAAYSFAQKPIGTYSFWYDPSYWQDGVRGRYDRVAQAQEVARSSQIYLELIKTVYLNMLVPFLVLLLISLNPLRSFYVALEPWELIIPAATGLILYSLVHTEIRFIAGFLSILWFCPFQSLRFYESAKLRRFIGVTLLAVAATTFWYMAKIVIYGAIASKGSTPESYLAARSLNDYGLRPGERIATISPQAFGAGGAYVARLARLQIVAQVNQTDHFWSAPASTQTEVLKTFQNSGCNGVLAWRVPEFASGWLKLGQTGYSVFQFRDSESPKLSSGP